MKTHLLSITSTESGIIIIGIIIFIAIFIGLREFFAWYWKTNKIIELLTEQNKLLKRMVGETPKFDNNNTWKCEKCGHVNPNSTYVCEKCNYRII
jgi:hypothetical protein